MLGYFRELFEWIEEQLVSGHNVMVHASLELAEQERQVLRASCTLLSLISRLWPCAKGVDYRKPIGQLPTLLQKLDARTLTLGVNK